MQRQPAASAAAAARNSETPRAHISIYAAPTSCCEGELYEDPGVRRVTRMGMPLAVWMVAPVAMPTCQAVGRGGQ